MFGVRAMCIHERARTDLLPRDMRVIDDRGSAIKEPFPEIDLEPGKLWRGRDGVHVTVDGYR